MASESSVKSVKNQTDLATFQPVLFKQRWFILVLFCTVSLLNAFQWLHVNIINKQTETFWVGSLPDDTHTRKELIVALSSIYMFMYIPMIVPATWLLNRFGLRVSVLIAAGANALGAWFKCLALELSQPYTNVSSASAAASFPLLFVGQTICAFAQVFILGVPAQLAATWFSRSELAMATAIGVCGNQFGCALGFALPPLMVPETEDFGLLQKGFRILLYGGAAIMTVDLIIVAFFFKEEPEIAPSRAQYKRIMQRRALMNDDKQAAMELEAASEFEVTILTADEAKIVHQSFYRQFLHSFKTPSFILLNICYGMNTAVYYAISSVLNDLLQRFFPSQGIAIGWSGFAMVIGGLVGSFIAGYVLKKTGHYRRVVVVFYLLSVISFAAFVGSLYSPSIVTVFFTMTALGFFQSGFLPLGFEYAAEITYPIDEGLTSGILNTSAHILGVILTLSSGAILFKQSALAVNIFNLVCLVVAGIPACFMKDDLKRTRAHETVQVNVELTSGGDSEKSIKGNLEAEEN